MKNKTKLFLIFSFFLIIVVFFKTKPCSASSGSIIISEFMANPKAVSDTYGEWIEIYNTSSEPINLAGWILKNQNSQHLIQGELVINPENYLVLCKNFDPKKNISIIKAK